jgi:signal transduction histidine kinase
MGAGVNSGFAASVASQGSAARPGSTRGRFADLSIRNKLLAMVLLPLLGVLPLLGALLLWWGDDAVDRLLLTKVRSDLAVAQGYFERVLGEVGASATGVAESAALQAALQPGGGGAAALLQRLAQRERLDFINLLAPDAGLMDSTSVEILEPAKQGVLGAALRQRVAVPLVATRRAAPSTRSTEDRAMVLLALRAVRSPQGELLGHVQAGVLLNRNLPFIDHINQIVYPEGSLPFAELGSQGTATLFLDDVRISTNVRLFGAEKDERAIGTQVSQTVREKVLGRGETWLDRAFVVNDWYVSAYQPLANGSGRRVGMLYVGILERPFTLLKYGALASIGALFAAAMLIAAVVSLRWARSIFRPLEQMEATMKEVEGGSLDARVGGVDSDDEIGRLAEHLDRLLAAIAEHTRGLDAKVAERTQALEAAQQQLVRSEKLATVGQLTASIAHEVNNPIAVIQGNLDLLRELLGPEASRKVDAELRLVDEQIERMRLIVTQLLQFARPTEYAGYVESVDTARALEDCLVLAGHQIARTGIAVQRAYRATRQPTLNRHELQQVLVNLMVNAIHAMPQGGTLQLATRDVGEDTVEIEVNDTGSGLSEELLGRLFQPFVTRRPDGTGLGLWISRGLVERYGGDIVAANRDDGRSGAVFTVSLKVQPAN